jgi:hypothetical protein
MNGNNEINDVKPQKYQGMIKFEQLNYKWIDTYDAATEQLKWNAAPIQVF